MIVVAERAGINISGTGVLIMENPNTVLTTRWKNSRLRCVEDVIPMPGEVLLKPFWLTNRQAMSFGGCSEMRHSGGRAASSAVKSRTYH
ncbi:hypothetical protein M1D89_23045 [Arthrobacter sp. D3-18]